MSEFLYKGRKRPINSIGYDCVNVLVQRAISSVCRKLSASRRSRAWNESNRERISRTTKMLYLKKREQRIAETTEYRQKNRKHLMAKQCEREQVRRRTDSDYHTSILLRQRLRGALSRGKHKKHDQTLSLVGASVSTVTQHLSAQWSFNDQSYEIDHIFPFDCYNLNVLEDQKRVMNYTNYQPLTVDENRSKWNRFPTKAMAAKVERWAWPDDITEADLPDIYPGWSTPLRM